MTLYSNQKTQKAADFGDALKGSAINAEGLALDSTAAAEEFNAKIETSDIPENLQAVLDECGDDKVGRARIIKATLDGINAYESAHGADVPGDLIEHAINSAYATSDTAKNQYALDSALDSTSIAADSLSLQPNRAVVAILSALGEAIPFAHYLPTDIGSNEAKLAILSHTAGKKYGGYEAGGLLDGSLSGDAYISTARVHATTNLAGAHTGQLTSKQATPDTCAAVAADVVAVNLLRGRTVVYVNGQLVARETGNKSISSAISGSITISGTQYIIGGTINTDTGVIAVTSTPALPNNVPVHVEGYIDYEKQPQLIPTIITEVETFQLFAKPWMVNTNTSIGSRTQFANELGLDPYSEGIIAIQAQAGNERHFEVLRKAKRLGVNNQVSFNFDWANQGLQKTRGLMWNDFAATLCALSQQMAIDTLGHGISHIYVGMNMASQLKTLPAEVFTPSGITARASIYRLGRLFGEYDVYYEPGRVLTDSPMASQILCIGRANDVTRNPFVLGDAVPPTVLPIAMTGNMDQGAAYYARNFTEVNPHAPSSLGCALIDVTNIS